MAIYHLSATPVQRSKGHSAVAAAAYRAGEKLHDARLDQVHDYQRKRGIVESQIIAPENAPAWVHDRAELWNRAELAEKRKDAQPAREIRLGLPHELTDEQRADLVYDYCREAFVSRGMIADVSIHRPDRNGDERNFHAHILLTMRELDGEQFSAKKNRDWNREETLQEWREKWEEYANGALEDAGSGARIDHRSLEAQGIGREATRHLGKEATAIEREGQASRIGQQTREVDERNRHLDQLVNELAEVEAEISAELEGQFLPPEPEHPPETAIFSFPTAQPGQESPTSLSDRLPYLQEQEENIRRNGWIAETGKSLYGKSTDLVIQGYDYVRAWFDETMGAVKGYWQGREAQRGNEPDKDIDFER